jgi:SulP family sulfate permease
MSVQPATLLRDVRGYSARKLLADTLSGVTVAVFAVPQAMAYAMLAGVAPVYGLYAAVVMSIVAALAGSSPYVNTGPTNSASLLAAAAVLPLAGQAEPIAIMATLCLMVGLLRLLMGLARMGSLLDFVSESAVLGFTVGAGTLIALGQLHHLLGVPAPEATWFPARIAETLGHAGHLQAPALIVGLATLGGMLLFAKRARRFPVALIVLGLAALAAWSFEGSPRLAIVRDIAEIPAHLPGLTPPLLKADLLRSLLPAAAAIAVIGLIEAASIGQALALRRDERLDVNREFVGQGLSQIAGAFFDAIPGSGSFSRSLLIESSGAATRFANVIFGVATAAALLLIPRALEWIPIAALSGLLAYIGIRLCDVRRIRRVFSTSAPDALVMTLTFAVTVFHRIEFGIFAGILAGALVHLHRTRELQLVEYVPTPSGRIAEVPFDEDRCHEPCDLVALGISGDLYYGISSTLRNRLSDILREQRPRHLVLRMRRAYSIDYSCWSALFDIAEQLQKIGGRLYLCGIRPDFEPIIRLADMQSILPPERIFPATDSPFEAFDRCMASILTESTPAGPRGAAWQTHLHPAPNGAGET